MTSVGLSVLARSSCMQPGSNDIGVDDCHGGYTQRLHFMLYMQHSKHVMLYMWHARHCRTANRNVDMDVLPYIIVDAVTDDELWM